MGSKQTPSHVHAPGERRRYDATVEANTLICRDHYLLRLRPILPPGSSFPLTRPGQFVQLGCRPPQAATDVESLRGMERDWPVDAWPRIQQPELTAPLALLRRPFSLAGRGDDDRGTWIEIIHRLVGQGTAWLAQLKPDDAVDLIGPLGNCFTQPPGKSLGLLVGGGVGLPPMFYLAQALQAAGWGGVAFVGALSADLLAAACVDGTPPSPHGIPALCLAPFNRQGFPAAVTTDDASLGLAGRVTLALQRYLESQSPQDARQSVVFTCGPNAMMASVAELAAAFSIPCQACMEQSMACGMGTCQSCVVKIQDDVHPQAHTSAGRPWRYRLACTDGPVFPGHVVIW